MTSIENAQELEYRDGGYESFYAELERQILILTDENDGRDFVGTTKKHTGSSLVANWRSCGVSQPEGYFCWIEKNENDDRHSLPTWLSDLWRNSSNGTGVFIPRVTNSTRRNKPRRKNNKRKVYTMVMN
ncbi:hypothetical protein OSB04_018149 [Centaurea solstitialis]|uniref:Uncharacterized protein n=1 Tax=Centaurea solstitialis TaxID=347529 RepID=A0AA38WLF0_9ASTR|nr:hypothetical protein OSB04_018149 [Centaurea solstitialis]